MKKIFFFLVLLSVKLSGQTARLEFEAPAAYPEGIVYDAAKSLFYVSSVTDGTIGAVDASGKYSIVYSDSTLKSTFGMKLSADGKKLWLCAGDPNYSKRKDSATFKKKIRLICLDLATRTKTKDIDLSSLFNGKHFGNDLALDNKGNIYVTDSFSPIIYKIDTAGKAMVYAQHESFSAVGVGLNGIVWHPSNFLLVVNNSNGSVLKVAGTGKTAVTPVTINQFFPGADGLLLDKQMNLILVQNKGVNKVFRLTSKDNWQTAAVTGATAAADIFSYPSTASFKNDEIWVMNAKLNELSDSNTVISKTFSIQKAELK